MDLRFSETSLKEMSTVMAGSFRIEVEMVDYQIDESQLLLRRLSGVKQVLFHPEHSVFEVIGDLEFVSKSKIMEILKEGNPKFLENGQSNSTEMEEDSFLLKDDAIISIDGATVISNSNSKRLKSVDVFKGIAVVELIVVSSQGDPRQAFHLFMETEWNGLSNGDLVIPFILFVVGISVAFNATLYKVNPRRGIIRILRNVIAFMVLGYLLNIGKMYSDYYPITGYLQRIAICYFCIALSTMFISVFQQRILVLHILLVYLCILLGVTVPGCGKGVLTVNCNSAAYIDGLFFGNHKTYPNDPNGVAATINSMLTVYLGVEFGRIIQGSEEGSFEERKKKMYLWICISCMLVIDGIVMHYTWHPFNHILYSLSFVLVTGGALGIVLLILYLLLDVSPTREYNIVVRMFQPVLWLGMFAVGIYISMFVARGFMNIMVIALNGKPVTLWELIYLKVFLSWLPTAPLASLAMATANLFLWNGIAFVMFSLKTTTRL